MTDDRQAPLQVSHDEVVPDAEAFRATRMHWRNDLAADQRLRGQAVDLQRAADEHSYGYTWDWLGVPVIRLPDDIVVLQELFWAYRPQCVVETGVARGGSLLLNASLMKLCGEDPNVLGIDLQIFEHTHSALEEHPFASGIELLEADSTSQIAVERTAALLSDVDRAVLVLDSNHTHEHVLQELQLLAPLLPVGSYVLVADTIVEEFPSGYYRNRPWDTGNNPATALRQFITERDAFEISVEWSRRALVTEFRDGILRRVR